MLLNCCRVYCQERCGLPISTYFSAVKVRWLLDNVPSIQHSLNDGRCMFGTVDTWLAWVRIISLVCVVVCYGWAIVSHRIWSYVYFHVVFSIGNELNLIFRFADVCFIIYTYTYRARFLCILCEAFFIMHF